MKLRRLLSRVVRSRLVRPALMWIMTKADHLARAAQSYYITNQIGHIGRNVSILNGFSVEHPENVFIGDNVIIQRRVLIHAYSRVTIEEGAMIAAGAQLVTPTHDFSKTGDELVRSVISKPITIGKHAVINSDAMVLGGVTVGEGAIVAAKSLVIQDVKPYTYVIGVPARVFFKRNVPPETV